MTRITAVGFDADDTLWHNERFYRETEARFADLLRPHCDPDTLLGRLLAAERRNLGHYGFGIKGFMLSMIETAADVTGGDVPAPVLKGILEAGREMLAHPVELLPDAEAAINALAGRYTLLLVTKGDLLDQERKVAASGLGDAFDGIEIVSDKSPAVYARVFAGHGGAASGVMAGNSMKSDVLPMIAAGGHGVFVPHDLGWVLEHAEPPEGDPRYHHIDTLAGLPPLVAALD